MDVGRIELAIRRVASGERRPDRLERILLNLLSMPQVLEAGDACGSRHAGGTGPGDAIVDRGTGIPRAISTCVRSFYRAHGARKAEVWGWVSSYEVPGRSAWRHIWVESQRERQRFYFTLRSSNRHTTQPH